MGKINNILWASTSFVVAMLSIVFFCLYSYQLFYSGDDLPVWTPWRWIMWQVFAALHICDFWDFLRGKGNYGRCY